MSQEILNYYKTWWPEIQQEPILPDVAEYRIVKSVERNRKKLHNAAFGASIGVIFDWDSTLNRYFDVRVNTLKNLLIQDGFTSISCPEPDSAQYNGKFSKYLNMLIKEHPELKAYAYYDQIRDLDDKELIPYELVHPDIPSFLNEMKQQGINPVAIATCKPQKIYDQTVHKVHEILPELADLPIFMYPQHASPGELFADEEISKKKKLESGKDDYDPMEKYKWKLLLSKVLRDELGIPIALIDDKERQRRLIRACQIEDLQTFAPEWANKQLMRNLLKMKANSITHL